MSFSFQRFLVCWLFFFFFPLSEPPPRAPRPPLELIRAGSGCLSRTWDARRKGGSIPAARLGFPAAAGLQGARDPVPGPVPLTLTPSCPPSPWGRGQRLAHVLPHSPGDGVSITFTPCTCQPRCLLAAPAPPCVLGYVGAAGSCGQRCWGGTGDIGATAMPWVHPDQRTRWGHPPEPGHRGRDRVGVLGGAQLQPPSPEYLGCWHRDMERGHGTGTGGLPKAAPRPCSVSLCPAPWQCRVFPGRGAGRRQQSRGRELWGCHKS